MGKLRDNLFPCRAEKVEGRVIPAAESGTGGVAAESCDGLVFSLGVAGMVLSETRLKLSLLDLESADARFRSSVSAISCLALWFLDGERVCRCISPQSLAGCRNGRAAQASADKGVVLLFAAVLAMLTHGVIMKAYVWRKKGILNKSNP